MSIWTRTTPPKFAPHAVAGKDGWIHPVSNEVLETFGDGSSNKPTVVTTPTINSVKLYKGFVVASGETVADKRTHVVTKDVITLAVQFNSQVVVTGQPYIVINFNGSPKNALYLPKRGFDFGEDTTHTTGGTATLLFYYTIASAVVATSGQVVVLSPVQLGTGTIKSLLKGNNATLTFTPPVLTIAAN